MDDIIGKRFRTLVEDSECDDDCGEVIHPIGSTFVVVERVHDDDVGHGQEHMYQVAWEQAIRVDNKQPVPPDLVRGMWTIWSEGELRTQAEPMLDERSSS